MRDYWPVILALVVAAAVIAFALVLALERNPQTPAAPAGAGPGAAQGQQQVSPEEGFYQHLEQMQPRYVTVEYACPVDGTKFKVESPFAHNRYGGVATDFMAITLAPPEGPHERPSLEKQEWEMMPASCPTCGATFMEIDLRNINVGLAAGADAALKGWKLSEQAPELAAVAQAQWTPDERLFVRYLTTKLAGFPHYELGFYALAAAYATNFSFWYGEPRHWAAPSAAYYALAAAEFRTELANPQTKMNEGERAVVLMTLGELYRLLDRTSDAAEYYQQARASGKLDKHTLAVLDLMESLLKQGDLTLHRVPDIGIPDPPVGWYLDEMLPAINGHIADHRAEWNSDDDPASIAARIRQVYAANAAPAQPSPQ